MLEALVIIIIVIVVLVVRRSRKQQGAVPREAAGTSIRRFFLYVTMLGTLLLAAFGLSGLLAAAIDRGAEVVQDTDQALSENAYEAG